MTIKCRFATVGVWSMIFTGLCGIAVSAGADPSPPALLPQPLSLERKEGTFALNKDTRILVEQGWDDAANVGKQLADRINGSTGLGLKVEVLPPLTPPGQNAITLTRMAGFKLVPNGYRLEVQPDRALIVGQDGPALFYGMQTLLQLLPPEVFSPNKVKEDVAWALPAVSISDAPRFVWRGLMLDVCRHFFNKQEVENFLDLMAQHKLNTFHWHLTDDQGWRIEIKRYPKLTEVGAWRKDIAFGLDPKAGTAYGPDGRYGGFFTQDDVREILAYAKARYITIVPEIEMPGHASAALLAYPELGCRTPANVYCAGNEATFEFLENVLLEIRDLFPCKYIHVGGDEVSKKNWKACEKCQARIQKEGLKDENELQSYFIRRIEKFLNAHDRTLIGWDEILEGGLAPNATVMSWRGIKGGVAAAKADHDVIMTPTSNCYFDYYQAKTGEPKAIGGFLPLGKVYNFEPVAADIPADKVQHVLGAAGNLWSEYFPNYRHVQYMAYPRGCAMAEVTWTDPKLKDWDDFQKRLETQLKRLSAQGVNFRPLRPSTPDQPAN